MIDKHKNEMGRIFISILIYLGLGDPQALNLAVSTMHAVQMLGMPESNVILCQCAVYLARYVKTVS